ncbi:amino acid ABC transporter substrate-binding protein [Psychromonas sp. MME2]|uniref:amino acid ABC transporter substrate-binding protein n=1 Tax=Psychromonas sp. MME2 TaxID=3231033 RepID=UPI00339C6943
MLKKYIRLLLSFILIFSVAPLCQALDKKPITFALSLSLTGENSRIGSSIKNGLLLWQKQVNSGQGILGHPVKLIFTDDQGDPKRAMTIYQDYVRNKNINFLFSPYNSKLTGAIMPIVEQAKIPLIAMIANSSELWSKGYKNIFGLLQVSTNITNDFIEILALDGDHKLAILGIDDAFGRSVADGAQEWADSIGVDIVLNHIFNKNEFSFNKLAKRVIQTNATDLIFTGSLEETIAMRRALANNPSRPMTFFSAASGAADAYYQAELGPLAEHTVTSIWWVTNVQYDDANVTSFKNAYHTQFKQPPSYISALSYAAGEIFQEAIERAGSINAQQVQRLFLA